ncbi:MAG TPA: STAS domain-containing protein [Variovorax sp.]
MAKEEPGRLLSKVAKFVRNPLKDWSELDAEDASTLENGYSREMLKEMIERRQRNDFVRRREFDMLRKLRQREAAGGRDPAATPSSFNVSSTSGKTEGRALTLKKIDEIEEQMSQQWWKSRGPRGEASGADPADDGSQMAAQHARAYADTVPGMAQPNPEPAVEGLQVQLPTHDGSIEEAAIRFAHGDDAGAEAILLQSLAPDSPGAGQDDTWLALLDLYRATGDFEKFVAGGTRYAQTIKRQPPEWVSFRALASLAQASAPAEAAPPGPSSDADWASPPRLAREGLLGLTRALAAAGATWRLDWSGLDGIAPDAAGPLRALFTHWSDSTVQLQFFGAERLLEVLAEATPASDRNVDAAWWQLHMAALRVMHRADEFELLALNYCITYEVSPPPWEDPKGEFSSLESSVLEARPVPRGLSVAPVDHNLAAPAEDPSHSALAGDLLGESPAIWQRLDAELADTRAPVISCAALVRIDFAAAGSLLNWVTERHGRGDGVQFTGVHRLIAAFFDVIGIADHASVKLR